MKEIIETAILGVLFLCSLIMNLMWLSIPILIIVWLVKAIN